MIHFEIRYALSGGFGGCENKDWEPVEADNIEEAEDIAYQHACEEYESYVGLHGLREVDEIMEEDGVDMEEAVEIYNDERESWIDYEAREVK